MFVCYEVILSRMITVWIVLMYLSEVLTYGYGAGVDQGACGRKYRSSRVLNPPCDLSVESYCAKAGSAYPWNPVRHFVRENQGLMKRMYGDQMQRSVIEAEMLSNDIEHFRESFPDDDLYYNGDFKSRYAKDVEFDNELLDDDENTPRLLREDSKIDDVINTKFVFPEKSIKYGDLMNKEMLSKTEGKPEGSAAGKVESSISESYNDTFYEVSESQNSTENNTEKATTTRPTDGTTDTTLMYEEATTTEPEKRKTSTGTVLFQDTNQKKVYNFKGQGFNACPVKQEVVAPYWANNTRGETLALINIYPYEQYIHCEICTVQHRQMYCRDGCRCEQQYRIHRLLAYDPNNECRGVFADWFKFPSCCVCKCYFFTENRVTARSPRSKEDKYVPNWFKKKSKNYYND